MTDRMQEALGRYWGYDRFLPLQREAMECVCGGRDSVVVLATGGGKSLCFQVPALILPGLTLVISPLLSLMKDQVDALHENGIPAARLDSTTSSAERRQVLSGLRSGHLKLLYVSPERVCSDGFLDFVKPFTVSSVAIDEAHCVSMWGHDFRPEYRQLSVLREQLRAVPIGAYTATATDTVRSDIEQQLRLDHPVVLVGKFDRPNLVYRVQRRLDRFKQVLSVINRQPEESGLVYCIRRSDVDEMCQQLSSRGLRVLPYHAGLADVQRKRNQDAFVEDKVQILVATVAFGMGIDKPNVRYVIHAGMPKSLEHYQQESGRAGRDGLEAECCVFFAGADFVIWKSILDDLEPEPRRIGLAQLQHMYRYCVSAACRHSLLSSYFGQRLDSRACQACDVCLGDVEGVADALVIAQKILSSVVRQGERFGADYTAAVLTGSKDGRVLNNRHDRLSTHGLLSSFAKRDVRDWIEQLVDQECIRKTGEFDVLKLTEKGVRVLRGQEQPFLSQSGAKPSRQAKIAVESWQGVDQGLFEALRSLRRGLADSRRVPAYVVFSDATLRDMARLRPSNLELLLRIKGVGEAKKEQYGAVIIQAITEYCRGHALPMDQF